MTLQEIMALPEVRAIFTTVIGALAIIVPLVLRNLIAKLSSNNGALVNAVTLRVTELLKHTEKNLDAKLLAMHNENVETQTTVDDFAEIVAMSVLGSRKFSAGAKTELITKAERIKARGKVKIADKIIEMIKTDPVESEKLEVAPVKTVTEVTPIEPSIHL